MTNKTYLQDKFEFRRQSLLTTTVPLDATNFTAISGFNVAGTQPVGSQRKFVFKVNDDYFIFSGNTPISFDHDLTLDNVLNYGNSAAELLAVSNVNSWAGQKIYPVIALDCAADANVAPTVRLSLNAVSANDIYSKTFYSPIYAGKFKFKDFSTQTTLTGNAACNFQIRRQTKNAWQSWESFTDAKFKTADQFQLRANISLTTLNGTDSAKIDAVNVAFAEGDSLCVDSFEIVSNAYDCGDNIATVYALVRHSFLDDKNISAYVCFAPPLEEKSVALGTGTGAAKQFTLPDADIDFNSLVIQIAGKNCCDFTYNSNANAITVTADNGKNITANYSCGIAAEDWQEMELQYTDFDENFDQNVWTSRFVYRLETIEDSQVVKIKFVADSGVEIFSTASGFSFD